MESNFPNRSICIAKDHLGKFKKMIDSGIAPLWVAPSVYYGFFHATCALLYVYSENIRESIDKGRKIKHYGALNIFRHLFTARNSIYCTPFFKKASEHYYKALKEREKNAYSTTGPDFVLKNEDIVDIAKTAGQYVAAVEFLVVKEEELRKRGDPDSELNALREMLNQYPGLEDFNFESGFQINESEESFDDDFDDDGVNSAERKI